nr:hypothetical protein [Tanacetum cinerariifolium]
MNSMIILRGGPTIEFHGKCLKMSSKQSRSFFRLREIFTFTSKKKCSMLACPMSDQVTRFKSTKEERTKIDNVLTNGKIRHGLERTLGLTSEVNPNARVLSLVGIDLKLHIGIEQSIHDKLNNREQPILPAPVVPAGQHVAPEILATHTTWIKEYKEIVGLMIMTMEPNIQGNLETLHAHEMLLELKTLFAQQAEQELLQTTLGKTNNELHVMLNLHEQTLPKNNAPALYVIQAGKVHKVNEQKKLQPQMGARGQNHGKGKIKQAYAPKPKIPPPHKREDLTKDSIYHECGEIGHWKRNCPQYLAELLKKKKNAASRAVGL